ncbi:MAG: hypothetical protein GY822_26720, partial [Deltaproteobacteria bacterium]|nr:hypothetical protein [Deltaproteobacteria bacterium]
MDRGRRGPARRLRLRRARAFLPTGATGSDDEADRGGALLAAERRLCAGALGRARPVGRGRLACHCQVVLLSAPRAFGADLRGRPRARAPVLSRGWRRRGEVSCRGPARALRWRLGRARGLRDACSRVLLPGGAGRGRACASPAAARRSRSGRAARARRVSGPMEREVLADRGGRALGDRRSAAFRPPVPERRGVGRRRDAGGAVELRGGLPVLAV